MPTWPPWTTVALLVLVAVAGVAQVGGAHTGGTTGFAVIEVHAEGVRYRLTLSADGLPADVGAMLRLAMQGDLASQQRLLGLFSDKIAVGANGHPCRITSGRLEPSAFTTATVTIVLTLSCPAPPRTLQIQDDIFDILGNDHHTLAKVEFSHRTQQIAFTPDSRVAVVHVEQPDGTDMPTRSFLRLGVEHILTGYDHLLFLLALLLGGGTVWSLLKIVTAFTLAHSATLAVAALGLVTIPARVVEPAIAASIVWVAMENLFLRRAPSRRWHVSFVFGLVHGFGFASALSPLDLPRWNLAMALLGFNLGVEAGQSLGIAVALPLLLWVRGRPWEPRVSRAISVVLAMIATVWLVERLFVA